MNNVLNKDLGDKAPQFEAESTKGTISLENYKDKYIVLYFYPKDMTPGCTVQANEFSSLYEQFKDLDAEIIGVSRDTVSSHNIFCEKENIAFPLISDADSNLCNLYGVLKEKVNFGKKYIGIVRSTFLIGKDQSIIKIWNNVKAQGHAAEVLEAIEKL
ncbi:Peroxiredoxin [Candidatus Cyrtobacter comes]|uniref:thioredoxin-dependent peroxiredoxin n=1 Tax=Candidatus Cyrtobacter comes TaxID=675776 RepID=A0ABU5L6U3_9RICK|nr:peroxiredoxin [Candidatus Cyrtobacter comes]MDZ5761847.1 Peroxiredoxin [Candidatus Cyrtobacter comes]